jgi:hypothetical protein
MDLIKEIKIDPEEPDPEARYLKNTLVEAKRIVRNGDIAVWNEDGAEKYTEMPIGDSILENEAVMNAEVTIEDDDHDNHDNSTIINDEEEIGH